jgi:hypothetical protein
MAATSILKIDIIADATKALKAMGLVEDKAGGTGAKLSGLGKTVLGAVGTTAVIGFGKASVQAAEESAVATARLDQVFKAMGDTTGKASQQAQIYAGHLSKRIGVEDELIMSAQAQLATFGNVSNAAARTAGVFDRATAAAADLAAAGFGTLDANSVQLGKALQDPTKGLAALAKSGVTFTDSQKAAIAAMQKSGDLLGAQNVVLKAIEGQVGGTAAATATNTDKMKVAYGELQETIGTKLLPVVNMLTGFLTANMDLLIPLGAAILSVVAAIKLYELGTKAAKVAQAAWNAVQVIFNVIMSANPIMLVVVAIAALVAAVIIAYNKVGWFRAFVDGAMRGVVAAFGWIRDAAAAVFTWISQHWPLLLAILTGPFGAMVAIIIKNWDTIKAAIQGFVDWLRGLISTVAGIARSIGNALKGPINTIIRAWNGLEFKVPAVDVGPVHFGGQTIGLPDIPLLATGGTVLRTGLAVVHRGETFSGVGPRAGAPSSTVNITVNATGLGAQAPDIQRAVVDALRLYTSRNGPLTAPIVAG